MTEINDLIKRYGSLRKAARLLGVHHMTIWRWSRGINKPSSMAREKIKAIIGGGEGK